MLKIQKTKRDTFRISNFEFRICQKRGFSLLEMVIYIGLLGILTLVVVNFLVHMVSMYSRAHAEREVISNARLIIETMIKQISYAEEVYAPTSRFNTTLGQLSLSTGAATTTEHTAGFFDYRARIGKNYSWHRSHYRKICCLDHSECERGSAGKLLTKLQMPNFKLQIVFNVLIFKLIFLNCNIQ